MQFRGPRALQAWGEKYLVKRVRVMPRQYRFKPYPDGVSQKVRRTTFQHPSSIPLEVEFEDSPPALSQKVSTLMDLKEQAAEVAKAKARLNEQLKGSVWVHTT